MGEKDMGMKTRRLIDAVDDLRAEIRLANEIAILALPTSALDDADLEKFTNEKTRARHVRLNRLRARVRAGLGLEGGDDVDRS